MTLLLLKYWKHLVVILSILGLGYLGYHKIYDQGYQAAAVEYNKKIKLYEDDLAKRISSIESASETLVQLAKINNDSFSKDLKGILTSIKGKPLFYVKEGKCTPSPEMYKAYNDAINRANKP
jgi:hypothetical protein